MADQKPAYPHPEAKPVPKKAAPRRFSHPEAKPVKQEAAPRRFSRPEAKPTGAPQRYPHPEAKPVGGQGLPQRSLHPQGQPPAAQGRPFGQEGKAQRPAANARLMALNILQDVTRAGALCVACAGRAAARVHACAAGPRLCGGACLRHAGKADYA